MKRIILIGGIVLAVTFSSIQLVASASLKLAPGEAEIVYTFADDQPTPFLREPEGIALDRKGNIFVSDRRGDTRLENKIIKIPPRGESSILADLGPSLSGCSGASGILGLTTDPIGNVYAAFGSCGNNGGVWKIYRNGHIEHLSGSEDIETPNALTFDQRGNLYVTDSSYFVESGPGLVWRYGKSRNFEVWKSSKLLAPAESDPYPFPAPGANGIAFYPPNHVYVVNNEKSLILHIPVLPDGNAGEVTVVAGAWVSPPPEPTGPPGLLYAPDGLSVDVEGNLYAACPSAGLAPFPLSPVIKIYPATGNVEAIVAPYTDVDPSPLFDFPTSLAFGTGPLDKKSLFVVNPTLSGVATPGASGQVITQVGVGVPGRTGQ